MNATTRRRRTTGLTALGAVALLALAACAPAESPPADTPASDSPVSDAPTSASPGTAAPTSDAPGSAGPGPEADVASGSDARRSLVVVPVVDPASVVEEEGEARLPSSDLADTLQDMGGVAEEPPAGADPASCDGDLRYVAGADARCTVTVAFDGTERDMTMIAHPLTAPGGARGVLFAADAPLTEDARWATFSGDNEVVALGMGGAYGMDPIPADRLAQDVQRTISFDDYRSPIDTSAWTVTVQDCEDALDVERLAPVRCVATHDRTGAEHAVWALPGTFFGQEPGLVVSLGTTPTTG